MIELTAKQVNTIFEKHPEAVCVTTDAEGIFVWTEEPGCVDGIYYPMRNPDTETKVCFSTRYYKNPGVDTYQLKELAHGQRVILDTPDWTHTSYFGHQAILMYASVYNKWTLYSLTEKGTTWSIDKLGATGKWRVRLPEID